MASNALILCGHGSHISPQTAGLVWHHVDGIRRLGMFDEVTAAFWKEAPAFSTVLNGLSASDVTVVPLFTSRGYFSQTVIPAEMGLAGVLTQRDGRTIRYTKTLSEHPYLGSVIMRRIAEVVALRGVRLAETAVAIIGHSTRRNPESRKATEAQAEALRQLNLFAQVVAVYLDDSPAIRDVYRLTQAPTLIAVPYFLALGSHTTLDVPAELGLPAGVPNGSIQGRQVYYTDPVGTDDALQGVIIELAREAGATLRTPPLVISAWAGFPQVGGVPLSGQIGQLRITPGLIQAVGDELPQTFIGDLGTLRDVVRGAADGSKRFRPLATSDDLPGGWTVLLDPAAPYAHARAVVETIYPGLLGAQAVDTVRPLAEVAARQIGMFAPLAQVPDEIVADTVASVCAHCVRHPTWQDGAAEPLRCPEACNVWLSAALTAAMGHKVAE